jgi:hypothetical protein
MKKYITIFITLTVFIISCQKEISIEGETNPTPPPSDSAFLLKKFIVLDTTLNAPNDTIFRYAFFYDNLQRCTSFKGSDGIDSFYTYNYYNGTDTLMSKRKVHSIGIYGDSTIEYFNYSPLNKVLTDSILSYEYSVNNTVGNFYLSYPSSSNPNGTVIVRSNGNQFEYNNFIMQRENNGNLLNVKDSLFVLSGANYVLTETANSNISYDNKINPFYKIVPNFLVNVLIESSPIFTFAPFQSLPQRNNILSETKIFNPQTPGLDNFNNSFQYIYNSRNYPTIVRVRDILNNKYYKGIYVY